VLLEADALFEAHAPGFELAPLGHAREQDAGGLEEVGSDHGIAAF